MVMEEDVEEFITNAEKVEDEILVPGFEWIGALFYIFYYFCSFHSFIHNFWHTV